MRRDIRFRVDATEVVATLVAPDRAGPHPTVVMGHGIGGVAQLLLGYAQHFVDAGFACLVFDYRHFGRSGGAPRQLFSVRKQLADWEAAIKTARALPEVDAHRIALWGTSFGGGHVITLAARHPEVMAVVAQCPAVDFRAITLRTLLASPGQALRLLAHAVADGLAGLFGRAHCIPLVGAPGTLAAMTAPGAVAGVDRLIAHAAKFAGPVQVDNSVTPRFLLTVSAYRPVAAARTLRQPLLICACDQDTIAPPDLAVTAAGRAPHGQVMHYDCDHFEIYTGAFYATAVADQRRFLQQAAGMSAQEPAGLTSQAG